MKQKFSFFDIPYRTNNPQKVSRLEIEVEAEFDGLMIARDERWLKKAFRDDGSEVALYEITAWDLECILHQVNMIDLDRMIEGPRSRKVAADYFAENIKEIAVSMAEVSADQYRGKYE